MLDFIRDRICVIMWITYEDFSWKWSKKCILIISISENGSTIICMIHIYDIASSFAFGVLFYLWWCFSKDSFCLMTKTNYCPWLLSFFFVSLYGYQWLLIILESWRSCSDFGSVFLVVNWTFSSYQGSWNNFYDITDCANWSQFLVLELV